MRSVTPTLRSRPRLSAPCLLLAHKRRAVAVCYGSVWNAGYNRGRSMLATLSERVDVEEWVEFSGADFAAYRQVVADEDR
ncbi:hypothetical protein ACFXJ8_30610 [Nonomuraea sp. NPDC059194]|uniref:hypothetical protein n=1 Tax=Nonomuraea sp. NPDC059194 TaxID=3346764 RepID=UPI0036C5FDE5